MRIPKVLIVLALCITAAAQKATKSQGVIYFEVAANSFSATGKWVSGSSDPKDQIAYPQEVEIDCFRGNSSCVEAVAEYYMGNPHITVKYLDIIRWDKNGIVASSANAACMTNTIMINFGDQTISAADSLKRLDEKAKDACSFLGVGQSQSYVFVLKGTDRWNKEHWKSLSPAR
jgi:hypothetical protein